MRALIVTAYREFSGGVESVNRMLQDILEQQGYRVDYLTADAPRPAAARLLGRIVGLPAATALRYRRIRHEPYDVVIANGEYALGIDHPNLICVFHGSYRGLRDHLRGFLSGPQFLSLSWQAWLQAVAAKARCVVAVSGFLQGILHRQGISVSRVINNCVDTELFSPGIAPPRGSYLFVGSYSRYGKGFDVLEALARRGLRIDCVTNAPPGGALGFIETVPGNRMPDVYRSHRLLVFPSRFESVGLVALEAMSCGLPIVMTSVGVGHELRASIPDFVIDVSEPDLVSAFAERIERIEQRYDAYAAAAREYVLQRHSYPHFRNEWRELIAERAAC